MTAGWQRVSAGVDREMALAAVDQEATWLFLWCAGKTTRSEHRDAAQALAYARTELISRMSALIVFYERGPEALPERRNPERITDAR